MAGRDSWNDRFIAAQSKYCVDTLAALGSLLQGMRGKAKLVSVKGGSYGSATAKFLMPSPLTLTMGFRGGSVSEVYFNYDGPGAEGDLKYTVSNYSPVGMSKTLFEMLEDYEII